MVHVNMYNCLPKQQLHNQELQQQQQQQQVPVNSYGIDYNYIQYGNNETHSPSVHESITNEQRRHLSFYNYNEVQEQQQQQQQQQQQLSGRLQSLPSQVAVPAAGNTSVVAAASDIDATACWSTNGFQVQPPLAATASGFSIPSANSSLPPSHPVDHWPVTDVPQHYNRYSSNEDEDMTEDRSTSVATEYIRFMSTAAARRSDNFEELHSSFQQLQRQQQKETEVSDEMNYLRRASSLTRASSAHYSGNSLNDAVPAERHSSRYLGEEPGGPTNEYTSTTHSTGSHLQAPFDWMKKQSYPIIPISGKTRTKDKYRIVYTELQKVELEKEFLYSQYITIQRKAELSISIGLSDRQVKIWFQNRRAKERKHKKRHSSDVTSTSRASRSKQLPHLQLKDENERSCVGMQADAVSKAMVKLETDHSNVLLHPMTLQSSLVSNKP